MKCLKRTKPNRNEKKGTLGLDIIQELPKIRKSIQEKKNTKLITKENKYESN